MTRQAFSAAVIVATARTSLAARAVTEYRIVTEVGPLTIRRAGDLRWNDEHGQGEVYTDAAGGWVPVTDAGIAGMAREEHLDWQRPDGSVLRWDDTEGGLS